MTFIESIKKHSGSIGIGVAIVICITMVILLIIFVPYNRCKYCRNRDMHSCRKCSNCRWNPILNKCNKK